MLKINRIKNPHTKDEELRKAKLIIVKIEIKLVLNEFSAFMHGHGNQQL